MDSVGLKLRDGRILMVGSLPIGKRPYLYLETPGRITPLASFRDEATAQVAQELLEAIGGGDRVTDLEERVKNLEAKVQRLAAVIRGIEGKETPAIGQPLDKPWLPTVMPGQG